MTHAMAIAVLPYEERFKARLADVSLDRLHWPLGRPEQSGFVGDLGPDDHIIVYPRSKNFWDPRQGIRSRISLIIPEPYVIHRRNYRLAILLQKRFFRIFTHRPALARWAPNALVMPFGGAWVDHTQIKIGEKTKNMSLIASAKKTTNGHLLRHEIAAWCTANDCDVDLLGRAYRALDAKEDGLLNYRYSVIIENARETGYFTEKLIDCLLCDTVPIYWGAQDIGRYFELPGMMVCESAEQLRQAIANAGPDDYKRRTTFIRQNREKALHYLDYEINAAERLRSQMFEAQGAANNGISH